MFENKNVELRWKNVPSKAKAVLLVMFGVCLLNGCSNAQHQAKVDELNTDYCTNDVLIGINKAVVSESEMNQKIAAASAEQHR